MGHCYLMKSGRRLSTSLGLIVCLALAHNSPAQVSPNSASTPPTPPSLSGVIEGLRRSIVHITVSFEFQYSQDAGLNPETEIVPLRGTGFIVDAHGHIATAAHVVDPATVENNSDFKERLIKVGRHLIPGTVKLKEIDISFPEKSDRNFGANANTHWDLYDVKSIISAQILTEDDATDIAILACERNPLEAGPTIVITGRQNHMLATMPHLITEIPEDGEMIAVSGFPLASIPVLVTNVGWIATSYYRDEKERSLYLGSIHTNVGDSGSPVYRTSDGAILGCVVSSRVAPDGSSSGLTVIVPVQRFLELLASSTLSFSNDTLASEFPREISGGGSDPAEEHFHLGTAFYKKQEFADAVIEYRAALSLNSADAVEVHFYLGLALEGMGLNDEAASEYLKAISLNPTLVGPHDDLGALYAKRGQFEAAIVEFRKATELSPNEPMFHSNLGRVLFNKGDLDDSIAQFEIVLKLQPNFPQGRADLEKAMNARKGIQNPSR